MNNDNPSSKYEDLPKSSETTTTLSAVSQPTFKIIAISIISTILFITLVLSIYFFTYNKKPDNLQQNLTPATTSEVLKQKLKTVTYDLYIPSPLLQNYNVEEETIVQNNTITSYVITSASGNRIIVTQQPRPPITEEVTRIKKIECEMGLCFIADLNGKYAAFVYGAETLLIASSTDKSTEDLEYFINHLESL